MRYRLLIWSLLMLCVIAVASALPFDRAVAQKDQPPTKAALPPAATKPPMEIPPTKAPVEPTAVPATKPPLATSAPTKTAWPTPPTGLPTKTLIPTAVESPTFTPSPAISVTPALSLTSGQAGQPTDNLSATSVNSDARPAPAEPNALARSPLIGVVFNDANGDGVQEENEPGLSGIAVIIATSQQSQTLLTDASGAYQVNANPQATVRVVPPAGWQVVNAAALPLDRARNFALQPDVAAAAVPAAPSVASSVINLTSIACGFLGLGALVWLGLLQHQRAQVTSFNAWARADLRLRSEAERQTRRARLTIDDAWIVALLNQAALDATGVAPGIDQLDRVVLGPLPALVGLGQDFQRLVFTPAPEAVVKQLVKQKALSSLLGESLRGVRLYPIDALNGDLFVVDDLAAALAAKAHVPIALPRTERWSVYVVAAQRGKVAR